MFLSRYRKLLGAPGVVLCKRPVLGILLQCKRFCSSKEEKTANGNSLRAKFDTLFGLNSDEADMNFTSRWRIVVPAVAAHMALGPPSHLLRCIRLIAFLCRRSVGVAITF